MNRAKVKVKARHVATQAIAEFLHTSFEAICESCGKVEQMRACDAEEVANGFYEDGWRVDAGENLKCGDCLK